MMPPDLTAASRPPLEGVSLVLLIGGADIDLKHLASKWKKALESLGVPHELILAVGVQPSADLVFEEPSIRLVPSESGNGVGACLRAGIAAAKYPAVVYSDSGCEPRDLKKIVEMLDQADVVSGCRIEPVPRWLASLGRIHRSIVLAVFGLPLETRPTWRGWRHWLRVARLRWTFGLRFFDPLSPFKAFRKDSLSKLKLQSDSAFVHAELLAKGNFLGCLMTEVPIQAKSVEVIDAAYGQDLRRVFREPEFVWRPSPSVSFSPDPNQCLPAPLSLDEKAEGDSIESPSVR